MVKPGELLTRLRALLAELTGGEQAAVLEFLSDPSARRIALAGSATEKAQAVNDWLNAHELAGPPASVGTDGLSRSAGSLSWSAEIGLSVPLPRAPAAEQMSLTDAISARRSRYAYSARPVCLAGGRDGASPGCQGSARMMRSASLTASRVVGVSAPNRLWSSSRCSTGHQLSLPPRDR